MKNPLLHDCMPWIRGLEPGDTWTCESCHQRWSCRRSERSGGLIYRRVSLWRWMLGLD